MTKFGSIIFSGRGDRRVALGICFALAGCSALAAGFGQSKGPDTTIFIPIAAMVWSLCDLLTAFFMLLMSYVRGRPALTIIAAAYIVSGLLTWPYITSLLKNTGVAAPAYGDQQVPPMLYLSWHIAFAAIIMGAYLYEHLQPNRRSPSAMVRIIFVAAGSAVTASFGFAMVVHVWKAFLPTFIVGGVFQIWASIIGVPLVIALTSVACIVLLWSQRTHQSRLTTWLTVALFTSLLDALLNLSTPVRTSYAWDVGKLLMLSTSVMLMGFLLVENAWLHVRTAQDLDARTNRGAARMRALWQIATSESTSESAHTQMILDVATAHIRSDRDVLGVLSHLHNGRIVVDAQACQGNSRALAAVAAAYAPGHAFATTDDVHALLDERGHTAFWSDSPELAMCVTTAYGVRSTIGSPIYIGNQTYFITFALADTLDEEPFIESDIAFVDVVASNISHRFHQRTQLERLQYQIEHDSLTALFNRTQFSRFGRARAMDGSLFGIIVLNLDAFRRINERAGQMTGDELLLEIASRLRHVDERDIVARLGGDDFAVLLGASENGETLAERLEPYESAFRQPFHTGDRDGKVFLGVTASLGAAPFIRGTSSFDETLSNANIALDASKASGGAIGTAFGPQLESIALERALENKEVRNALQNNEFVLEYQPTVEMVLRTVVGAEALIRWQHPTRGRLAPAAFLGLVNRANLLAEMTLWVMERVAADIETAVLPAGIRVYVNVPAQVLETDAFLSQLETLLDDHPALAHRLGLEITESDVMNRVERAISTLQSVRRLGVRVAIDDFGTGYSSLSYLKRLPIDIVKLDKTFIDGLPEDENDIALAKMFLSLTKQFNFISVAEGVETEQQALWLSEQGCMIVQGYLFSRPIPFQDFVTMVQNTNTPQRLSLSV